MATVAEQIATAPAAAAMTQAPASGRERALRILAFIVLVLVAFAMFVPFIFSISTSLKTQREANQLLSPCGRSSGLRMWCSMPTDCVRLRHRSLVCEQHHRSCGLGVFRVFTAATAGYAFARMRFPGKNLLFIMVLSTIMIPGILTIVPKFLILKQLHLLDSYGALTLPFAADAFAIFLMKQFFESIPVELEEAARVDGASRYRMFAQIILPNAMPAITAVAIFSFQGSWNAFLEPLILINSADLHTLPLGLAYFRQTNYTDWPVLMAGAVITTIPIAIFYIVFQRWFVQGQISSGIKG